MSALKNVSDFEEILDICLARIQSGERIEHCLADYPECAGQLRPLLLAATAVQSTPPPAARRRAIEQGQAAMLAALANQKKVPANAPAVSFDAFQRYAERILSVLNREIPPKEGASQMKLALRSIVSTVLVLFVSGFLALAISANSLPGEPFYPIKRGWESARLSLTFDPNARQLLEEQIQQNRQGELTALIELGRQTQFVFEGIVDQVSAEQLIVDGFVFDLSQETRLLVEPAVGQAVRIETEITAEGRLIALMVSAGVADSKPPVMLTVTATPCNDPTCSPPTATPTPCNTGACGGSTPTPLPTNTPGNPTPTPCNTPACIPQTATPTPTTCSAGICGGSTPTPIPTNTPGDPTPTPCNSPACATSTSTPTPCTNGACGGPTPTSPPATSTPNNPTPTPCNDPSCTPPTPTPTPCNTGACGGPTPTPIPTNTPGDPTPTPCNSPACATSTPSPTPCNTGACGGPTPTPPPTNTPGDPTPTPCNSPACSTPLPTPTTCSAGACLPSTSTPTPGPN